MILGGKAAVIWPKPPDDTLLKGRPCKAERLPNVKFGRLNKLKNSARNCNFCVSAKGPNLRGIVFSIEKSKFARPGPTKMLRPVSPKVPTAFVVKALVLNHSATCWPRVLFPGR